MSRLFELQQLQLFHKMSDVQKNGTKKRRSCIINGYHFEDKSLSISLSVEPYFTQQKKTSLCPSDFSIQKKLHLLTT